MPLPEIVIASLGVALVVLAVVWRLVARRRSQARVRAALESPDRDTRLAAIGLVGQRGLAPHARLLLERLRTEPDREVLDALVTLVARHQWEPADSIALVELRLEAIRAARVREELHDGLGEDEHVMRWDGQRVLGDAEPGGARELIAAASAALGEDVLSLSLVPLQDDAPTLVVERDGGRGLAVTTGTSDRAQELSAQLRGRLQEGTWA